jgi:hypothetical protein
MALHMYCVASVGVWERPPVSRAVYLQLELEVRTSSSTEYRIRNRNLADKAACQLRLAVLPYLAGDCLSI